ncbi:MAG: aminoacyl-tRNA hydrolase [Oligoflexia bacterium]|nr:aminoacyl-tRNA hydrolase [Oligoflexia bacterium]
MSAKLVVGLGNPGTKYQGTRHNFGEMVLQNLPFARELSWQKKYKGFYASYSLKGEKVHFLYPQTYMNLSGESVIAAASFFSIKPTEILVLHDELDLPFGRIAFKRGGGAAGHNGLRSIIEHLGSPDFIRMRLGISRPVHANFEVSNWVLSKFSLEEAAEMEDILKKCGEAVVCLLQEGISKASSLYNRKEKENEKAKAKEN